MPIGVGLHLFFAASATEGHKKLKNIAFVRDFEHFDNEIDLAGIEGLGRHGSRQRQASRVCFVFTAGHGVILLVFMPTWTMSTSGPKDLDEKVSELRLPALGAELTVLTQVMQRSRLKALSMVSTTVIGL